MSRTYHPCLKPRGRLLEGKAVEITDTLVLLSNLQCAPLLPV